MYTASQLASLFPQGNHSLPYPDSQVLQVCIDSRKAAWQPQAIFLALQGSRIDGHRYIPEAWQQGVRTFLIREDYSVSSLPEANFIRVPDVLDAFHTLATWRRKQYDGKVIAIIGSNGKTWVKEWLYMLLYKDLPVYRSPGSYNSQVGVPLSVWNIPADSQYAIIEAGISAPGEMQKLQRIIQPDTVIFTHLGDAHDEGFGEDPTRKLKEKFIMALDAASVIFPADESGVADFVRQNFPDKNLISWSVNDRGTIHATTRRTPDGVAVDADSPAGALHYQISFSGPIAVSNSLICLSALHALGVATPDRMQMYGELQPIDMRLKAEDAIQGCVLINDSYSLDLDSLQFALESLEIAGPVQRKTLILSDHAFGRPGIYQHLVKMITGAGVDRLLLIGQEIAVLQPLMPAKVECHIFHDIDDLIRKGIVATFQDEVILLKGARKFGFEKLAARLRLKSHSAVLHVDFAALDHNLRFFYRHIVTGVKKIAVVKANAYGAGSLEVCRFLAYQHVDMLAVALIDEGIELREAGISIPVIVLNPDPDGMELILEHHLEPEIYNQHILQKLIRHCEFRQEPATIHIKLDSGTHRLGFGMQDIPSLLEIVQHSPWITIGSLFTHLSGSDEARWDEFTRTQVARFDEMNNLISSAVGYQPLRHVLSSAGILRFPEYQYEAVRLGIGLYGVGMPGQYDILPVHQLKARVLHLQEIGEGESVSYSRSYIADQTRRIATVNIGYADGLPRRAGDVGGSFRLHGQLAPITGRVCMDMTMIDVTHIPDVRIGDEVTIFDQEHSIELLARACQTIPYEILTHLNPRIRKVYEHG